MFAINPFKVSRLNVVKATSRTIKCPDSRKLFKKQKLSTLSLSNLSRISAKIAKFK